MSRRLSVALVAACPFPARRGTPIRIERLAEALVRRGLDVHVVAYHLGEAEESPQGYTLHRIPALPFYQRSAPGPSYQKLFVADAFLALKLRRVLARYPVDLVHAHHAEGLLAALTVPRRLRGPLVFDAHTVLESELPYYGLGLPRGVKQRVGSALDRWLPHRADHVVAVTPGIEERLRKRAGLAADRVSVVSNGIEPQHFPAPSRSGASAEPTLVFAGNFSRYQRIDLLLAVFRIVLDAQPSARLLLLAEDGNSFAPYRDLARELGLEDRLQVETTGFDALPGKLARADVALDPRTGSAGLPQKQLNYMAAGLPTVSFAGGAGLNRHLETGWVAEDVDDFAAGATRLLTDADLADRLGSQARKRVLSEQSWEHAAERIEQVYRKLLDSGTPRGEAGGGTGTPPSRR